MSGRRHPLTISGFHLGSHAAVRLPSGITDTGIVAGPTCLVVSWSWTDLRRPPAPVRSTRLPTGWVGHPDIRVGCMRLLQAFLGNRCQPLSRNHNPNPRDPLGLGISPPPATIALPFSRAFDAGNPGARTNTPSPFLAFLRFFPHDISPYSQSNRQAQNPASGRELPDVLHFVSPSISCLQIPSLTVAMWTHATA